jgi:hypothetical protein
VQGSSDKFVRQWIYLCQDKIERVKKVAAKKAADAASSNNVADAASSNNVADAASSNNVVDAASSNNVADEASSNNVVDAVSSNNVVDALSSNNVVDGEASVVTSGGTATPPAKVLERHPYSVTLFQELLKICATQRKGTNPIQSILGCNASAILLAFAILTDFDKFKYMEPMFQLNFMITMYFRRFSSIIGKKWRLS